MLTKTKSAAPVQTSGLVEEDIISNAKVSERLGTTQGCINLVQTHTEDRNQGPSISSATNDLNSALNIQVQDPLSPLAHHNTTCERPPPERDKLTTSAELLSSYLLAQESPLHSTAHDLYSALNDLYYIDLHVAFEAAEANYQRFLDLSKGVIKKPTIRVTLQEEAYQIDKEGIIVLASELSITEIGEIFCLLLNADAEFVSEGKVEVDSKAVEESLDCFGTKLKTPRTEAETTLDYFQRLSLLVFYEPHRLEAGTVSAAWAMWAEKFFVHG